MERGAGQLRAADDPVRWLLDIVDTRRDGDDRHDRHRHHAGGSGAGAHAVLVRRGRARFVLPVASRRAAAGSLTAYNRLRPPRTRLVRAAIGSALRLGAGDRLLRHRLDLGGDHADADDRRLTTWLCRVLGEDRLLVATGLRSGDTFAKPVLQLFRPDGTPVGYAKVGWNEVTIPRVRREAEVLAAWPDDGAPSISAPRLLHAGDWAGRFVAVTAPMPAGVRRLRPSDPPPALAAAAIWRSAPVAEGTLATSQHWRALAADARRLGDAAVRSGPALAEVVERIAARHLEVPLRFGRWHGDWVHWNLAMDGARLWAWDWEYSDPAVPVGFDVVHHLFQESFVGRGRSTAAALAVAAREGHRLLAGLGFDDEAVAATVALHGAELLRRDAAAEALGAGPDPRLEAAVVGAATA